jgi:hypothetical protein
MMATFKQSMNFSAMAARQGSRMKWGQLQGALSPRDSTKHCTYRKCHKTRWKSRDCWPRDERYQVNRPVLCGQYRMNSRRDGKTKRPDCDAHGDV